MATKINDALGKQASEKETSKEIKEKNTSKSEDIPGLNTDILSQMMMTGDNEYGMFAPDTKQLEEELEPGEKLHEEQNEEAKLGKIKSTETKDAYKKAMIKDMSKHPDKYSIETPRGRMSVAEAIKQGFNPETKQFEKSLDEKNKEALSRLSDEDRTRVEEFIDPAQVGLAPADADAFEVSETSPMRKPMTSPVPQTINPEAPVPGNLQGNAIPQTGVVPQAPTTQGADILSMLGGN